MASLGVLVGVSTESCLIWVLKLKFGCELLYLRMPFMMGF